MWSIDHVDVVDCFFRGAAKLLPLLLLLLMCELIPPRCKTATALLLWLRVRLLVVTAASKLVCALPRFEQRGGSSTCAQVLWAWGLAWGGRSPGHWEWGS
jgi:hypothetical protein